MEPVPAPAQKHLRVVSLQTSNYKKIRAVRVDPDPSENVILIGGEIDNGKSSLLDSMLDALGGRDSSPDVPVRKGMKKSETVIDLGDITCRLRHTAAGGRELILEDKDGKRMARPQEVMDALTGKVGFDAEEFIRRDPKDQLTILRKIVGIDFGPIEGRKKTAFDARTLANADVKRLEAQLAGAPNPSDAPTALVDTAEVISEMGKAQKHNEDRHPLEQANLQASANVRERIECLSDSQNSVKETMTEIDRLEKEMIAAKEKLVTEQAEMVQAQKNLDAEKVKAGTAAGALASFVSVDLAPFQEKIAGAEDSNTKFRQKTARDQIASDLRTAAARAQSLSDKIDECDAEKQRLLESAKFPVKGLSFTEAGILFDGIPFDQAASSTKRRVSVAIGAALNPTLRVMVVKDGSLLGTKGIDQLRELAKEHDLQIWIEVVTSDEEDRKRCTVVIEDGTVLGAPKVEDIPEAPENSSTPQHAEPPADLFKDLPSQ